MREQKESASDYSQLWKALNDLPPPSSYCNSKSIVYIFRTNCSKNTTSFSHTNHPLRAFRHFVVKKARKYVGHSWFELAGHTRFPLFSRPYCFCAVNTWRRIVVELGFHPTTVNRHNAMKDTVLIRMAEYHCSSTAVALSTTGRKMERGWGKGEDFHKIQYRFLFVYTRGWTGFRDGNNWKRIMRGIKWLFLIVWTRY